jgi:predicted phosphodiesterase
VAKKTTSKLWFFFPDIHFPEHDEEAVACAMAAHRVLKPTNTVMLGDVMDCGIFSAHTKRTIPETLAYNFKEQEIDPVNSLLDDIQKQTKSHTYYLQGNHEERIERWAVNNGQVALSLFDLLNPMHTIAKGRKNFTMIPYSVPTGDRMGYVQITSDLVAVHGWSFARHAAQIHLEKSRSRSIVFGHTHRHQVASGRDPWTGKSIRAFSPGCLSKLQPLYMTGGNPTDWSQGFAMVYVGRNSWTEYCVTIENGKCVLPDGREISA